MSKQINVYTIIDPRPIKKKEGGGHQSSNDLIKAIEKCGFEVNICTPKDEFIPPDNSYFNVLIDPFNDPEGSQWFSRKEINRICGNIPYIWMECAYTSFTTGPYGLLDLRYKDLTPVSEPLIHNALKMIVSSPLHAETINEYLKKPIANEYIHPRIIDTETFYNYSDDLRRGIEYLYVGPLNYFKGPDLVRQLYPTTKIYGPHTEQIPNCELPVIYNMAKNFVHLPRWKEPFGRTVAEAALCGCNIIGNENVGALSYNEDLSDPEFYKQAKIYLEKLIKEL